MDHKLVVCPFDKSHVVSDKRIHIHIIKCKKTYTGNKIPCPYNASEYIDPANLKDHLAVCKNRIEKESQYYYSLISDKVVQAIDAPFFHEGLPEIDENWES